MIKINKMEYFYFDRAYNPEKYDPLEKTVVIFFRYYPYEVEIIGETTFDFKKEFIFMSSFKNIIEKTDDEDIVKSLNAVSGRYKEWKLWKISKIIIRKPNGKGVVFHNSKESDKILAIDTGNYIRACEK